MLQTLPSISRLWHNRPTYGGHINKVGLDMASPTSHQSMVELWSCFNNLHISTNRHFGLDQPTSQRCFWQTEFGYGFFSLLPTHGKVFGLLQPLTLDTLP